MAEKTTNYNLTKPSADDFYNVDVQNGNMDIVDAELKKLEEGKAPAGHGLGDYADNHSGVSIKSIMHKGCGFYQVNRVPDVDNPADTGAWLTLLQMARGIKENEETGVQILCSDLKVDNPRMWFRNMLSGVTSNWVEMLHTGNYSSYANARIANGYYDGVVTNNVTPSKIVLSFDFPPKLLIVRGQNYLDKDITVIFVYDRSGHYIYVGASNAVGSNTFKTIWNGNSIEVELDKNDSQTFNWSGKSYTYVAIG